MMMADADAPRFGHSPGDVAAPVGNDPQVIYSGGADINADEVVDASDLSLLLSQWGPCASMIDCFADLDGNGAVDLDDLVTVLQAWRR